MRAIYARPWTGYAGALALTGVVTGLIAAIRVVGHVSNISMLYLLAVLASAVVFGSGPAILASAAAFLEYDVLFIEPRYRLTVAEPGEWVALVLLLVTGIMTGQLAAALRRRAREAERREREASVLYDVVRLMADPDVPRALGTVAERLRRELNLAAVRVDASGFSPSPARAESGSREALELALAAQRSTTRMLREGEAPSAERRGSAGRWIKIVPPQPRTGARPHGERLHIVPIGSGGGPTGTIVLVRGEDDLPLSTADDRLLSAVASQIAVALERAQLRDEATEAEVLRRTDELKTALLNAVSHDLRTPLSSIIASAGSLRQEDVAWSDAEKREFATAIEEEAQRLNRLVGNLLDLSRIEGGSLRPEKGWYDLGALIDDVVGRLRSLAANHQLIVEIEPDLPPVLLDYVEIDEVLANLIENAVKYTPRGSEIRLRASRAGNELRMEVLDNGPGVPERALRHLFEPFYRVPGPGSQPKGTGLGLAVASGLVKAHGGRIWVENRPEGGALFVFTLPLSEAPTQVEQRV